MHGFFNVKYKKLKTKIFNLCSENKEAFSNCKDHRRFYGRNSLSQEFSDGVICIIRQKKNILFEGKNMDNLIKKEGINHNWKMAIRLGIVTGNYHYGLCWKQFNHYFPKERATNERDNMGKF